MKKTAICIIVAIWILLGIIQIYASFSLFDFLGLNLYFAIIIAFAVGWMPIIGSTLAVIGAVKLWDWNVINAILFFFVAIPASFILPVLVAFLEDRKSKS